MKVETFRKTGLRAAIFAGLFSLTAGILYTSWHSGDLAKMAADLGAWMAGSGATTTSAEAASPPQPPASTGEDANAAWSDWVPGGKKLSSGISQVIVPAAKKTAAQALAAVDNVIQGTGPHYGGSYSFHQSVGFVPGYPGWVDEGGGGGGGGGCYGSHCGGGGDDDCHRTNTCGGGDDDCHKTNTCGGGDDCHKTNTCGGGDDCHKTNTCGGGDDCHTTNTCECEDQDNCPPHDVAEPASLPLLSAALLTLAAGWRFRRRRVRTPDGCDGAPKSR